MKKWLVLIVSMVMAVAWSGVGLAAESDTDTHDVKITVNEVAELRIEGGGSTAVVIGAPDTAGDSPKTTWTDKDAAYLQYTSIVQTTQTRRITAEIKAADNKLPDGVALKVNPTTAGCGQGTLGTAGGEVTLDETARDIVTGIGSGWTGTGGTDGVKLEYSVELTAADLKETSVGTTTITYTLTEGAGGPV